MVSTPLDTKPVSAAIKSSLAMKINWEFCHAARTLSVLRRFMSEAAVSCRASEATFWVINADGKRIEGAVNCGPECDLVEKVVVHANDSVVGLIATTGISLCVGPGEYMNPEVAKQFSVRNMVVAPVTIESQICGVVSAVNVVDGEKFTPSDLDTLQWKAYLLGLMLNDLLNGVEIAQ